MAPVDVHLDIIDGSLGFVLQPHFSAIIWSQPLVDLTLISQGLTLV